MDTYIREFCKFIAQEIKADEEEIKTNEKRGE